MRQSGILMPVFALPEKYGIGTFGKQAERFIDFLAQAGQTYWQLLPLSPTSYGDSPYQSFSAFAGNPYFIDLDRLCEAGLLEKGEYAEVFFGSEPTKVDYKALYENRLNVLSKAAKRFLRQPDPAFSTFCKKQDWLEDYALFMAIKEAQGGRSWQTWEPGLKFRDSARIQREQAKLQDRIGFHKTVQYFFFTQWAALRRYARQRGIQIIGDVPIYVALDSADVWAHPENFWLDERLSPVCVAGCPPDSFTETGQLWGNPLFDWDYMKKVGYRWWIRRIQHSMVLFDVIRIDHFRGFEAYYAIPADAKTAEHGYWKTGPGLALFDAIRHSLGHLPIIAEDLGLMSEGVQKLLQDTGFPGMKVLQFAFDSREDSDHLPHNYPRHCVAYTGTHDNDTALGWMQTAPAADVAFAKKYLHLTEAEGYARGMMRGVWASPADIAIVQMQDVLGLGSETRINAPGTMGSNWRWRMRAEAIQPGMAEELRDYMAIFKRMRKEDAK